MTIDALPEAPSTADPTNFDSEADAFVSALNTLVSQFNTDIALLNSISTQSTSTTSNTVGTGSKSFTVQTGKSYFVGMSLTIARTAAPTNRMFVVVDSYNSGTGALVVTSQSFEGSGTFTDWSITLGFNGVVSNAQLSSSYINDLSTVTIALGDSLSISDVSDSGNKKKALVSDILKIAPTFSASAAANQSITSAVATKVTLGTEIFDTNGNFASSRFTPTVAGYYLITGVLRGQATNLTNLTVSLYFNGSAARQGGTLNLAAATVSIQQSVSEIFLFNGSTDYVELYGVVVGTTPIFQATDTFSTSSMSGVLVRAV
jgi:hypothetical protein